MIVSEMLIPWIPKAAMAVVILAGFWLLAKIIKRAVMKAGKKSGLHDHIAELAGKASQTALILFGLVTAFGTLGIDISALVAGLGLTGFAVGFALKDIISNLLAGVLLLIYRPFTVGEVITMAPFTGKVTDIDLRYTTLEGDGEKVLIPNSNLFVNPIKISTIQAKPVES